jgi:hypothetical protein
MQRKFPALQPALVHSSPNSKTASQGSKRHIESTSRCRGDGLFDGYISPFADVCASISNLERGTTAGLHSVTKNKVLYCGFVSSHKFSRANDNATVRVQSLPAKGRTLQRLRRTESAAPLPDVARVGACKKYKACSDLNWLSGASNCSQPELLLRYCVMDGGRQSGQE